MDFRDFECASRVDDTRRRCYFVYLQTAISLRHSDTVDARFLVDGKRITVAMPHVAFREYAGRHTAVITDNQAAAVAASYLRAYLENGGDVEDLTVPAEQVLELAEKIPSAADTLIAKI